MRPALFIAILVLTVAPMGVAQKQSARGSHETSVDEVIKKVDNERIQAQIHADATALDRIYADDFRRRAKWQSENQAAGDFRFHVR